MTSAFVERENALATLNAGVNTPEETIDWRKLKGEQFFDWVEKHPDEVKSINKQLN